MDNLDVLRAELQHRKSRAMRLRRFLIEPLPYVLTAFAAGCLLAGRFELGIGVVVLFLIWSEWDRPIKR